MPCIVPIFLQSWTRCQWVRGQTSPGRRGHTHGRVRLQRWTRHVSDTWLRVLVSGLPSGNVRSKCVLRHLVHRWGARTQHAVLVRIASRRLPQRAASFADGPTRHHCSWSTPRPRWVGWALLKTPKELSEERPAKPGRFPQAPHLASLTHSPVLAPYETDF